MLFSKSSENITLFGPEIIVSISVCSVITSLQIVTSNEMEECLEHRTFRRMVPMSVLYSTTNYKVMYRQTNTCGKEYGKNFPMFSDLTLSVMCQRKNTIFIIIQ